MLKVQSNSRQIPSVEKYTADKQYCDLLYGVLQEMSYLDEHDGLRYVNKKDIVFTKLSKRVGSTRQTTSTKFNNLIKIGLVEYCEDEERYRLNYLDKTISSLIPFETLKLINDALSHNCISLYVYFLKRYLANQEQEYVVTMSQMKNFIGIATDTTSNNSTIINILIVLKRLNLVEWEERQAEENKTLIYITKVRNKIC